MKPAPALPGGTPGTLPGSLTARQRRRLHRRCSRTRASTRATSRSTRTASARRSTPATSASNGTTTLTRDDRQLHRRPVHGRDAHPDRRSRRHGRRGEPVHDHHRLRQDADVSAALAAGTYIERDDQQGHRHADPHRRHELARQRLPRGPADPAAPCRTASLRSRAATRRRRTTPARDCLYKIEMITGTDPHEDRQDLADEHTDARAAPYAPDKLRGAGDQAARRRAVGAGRVLRARRARATRRRPARSRPAAPGTSRSPSRSSPTRSSSSRPAART